jgi:predicted PurR-regulated permease PerM
MILGGLGLNNDENSALPGNASAMRVNRIGACELLVFGALGVLLYVAHAAFIPIALALLFALVLSGPVEALRKRRVPRSVSAFFILAIALGIFCSSLALLWKPAQYWYTEAPHTIRTMKLKFAPIARFVSRVDDIGNAAGTIGTTVAAHSAAHAAVAPAPAAPSTSMASAVLGSSLGAAVSSVTFMILTFFLLTGGPPMLARMSAAFVDDLNASHILRIIEAVRREVGRFYAVTALINLGLGVVTTGAMMLLGMPTPYVWGVTAALLNFIPYAGPVTTLVIITFVASMTFQEVPHIVGVAGTFLAITTIEGQIVQPLFVGRRLQINPLLIFLGLWLGGLFWGVAGVLLATPVLVALKVIAEHASRGRGVLEFLGPNNQSRTAQKPLRNLVNVVGGRRKSDRVLADVPGQTGPTADQYDGAGAGVGSTPS